MIRTMSTDQLPKTGEELSRFLTSKLRIEDMPPDLWLHLTDEGFIRGAIHPPNLKGVQDSLVAARGYLARHAGLARPAMRKPWKPRAGKLLGRDVLARAKMHYDRQMNAARQHRDLRAFRSKILGGRTLSDAEAASVLESDATRFLQPAFFAHHGIPFVGHTATTVLPDGRRAASWDHDVLLRIEWSGGKFETPYLEDWFEQPRGTFQAIAIPNQSGNHYLELVSKWSVLDKLREASVALSRDFPWKEHEAVWFILTDRLLSDAPVQVWYSAGRSAGLAYGRITLEIDSWVPPSLIRLIYEHEQRFYFEACPKPKRANQLEMFTSVQADLDEHPFEFTWQELMTRWNAKRPKRRYKDYRQLAKDFKRAAGWVKRVMVTPRFAVFKDSFWWANVDTWPELPPAVRRRRKREP